MPLTLTAVFALSPLASAKVVRCHVVTDESGDGVRTFGSTGFGTPNDPALDVRTADVGIGARSLAFVIRVTGLGEASAQGPQTYQWQMYFQLRGKSFATNATRAVDGTNFTVVGEFPETESVPAFTTAVPVTGSFDASKNEIRVEVPRRLLPVIRPSKDSLMNLTVDSITGAGLLATGHVATAGTTVDRTKQPGPRLALNSSTCVRAS